MFLAGGCAIGEDVDSANQLDPVREDVQLAYPSFPRSRYVFFKFNIILQVFDFTGPWRLDNC